MKNRKTRLILMLFTCLMLTLLMFQPAYASQTGNTLRVGDYVSFGQYLDADIKWQVVDKTPEEVLLYSEHILTYRAYDGALSGTYGQGATDADKIGSNYWTECNLRDWLNSMDAVINFKESPPAPAAVKDGLNAYAQDSGFMAQFSLDDFDSIALNHLGDHVFVLGNNEIREYVAQRGFSVSALATPQARASSEIHTAPGTYSAHWLRDPFVSVFAGQASIIPEGDLGSVVNIDSREPADGSVGVRPALYLYKENILIEGGAGTASEPYKVAGKERREQELHVLNTQPKQNSINISASATITINFDEDIKEGVSYHKIKLRLANGEAIPISKTINTRSLEVRPQTELPPGQSIVLELPRHSIYTTGRGALQSAYQLNFKTSYPGSANDQMIDVRQIEDSEKIWTIRFSSQVSPQSLIDGIIVTTSAGQQHPVELNETGDPEEHAIQVKPLTPYQMGETYKLDVTSQMRSLQGDQLRLPASLYFTVVEAPDVGTVEPVSPEQIIDDPGNGLPLVNYQIIVTFNIGTSEEEAREVIARYNGTVVGQLNNLDIYQVNLPANLTLDQQQAVIEQIKAEPSVVHATHNRVLSIEVRYPDAGMDPEWSRGIFNWDSWNQDNPAGRTWGLEAIKAPGAWDLLRNNIRATRLGVVDGGFAINHEDLGLSEDRATGSFNRYLATPVNNTQEARQKAEGNNSHGTHVVGTIAARSNNSVGITGVQWNRDPYMYRTDFTDMDIMYGIAKLLAKNCKAINMSLGWNLRNDRGNLKCELSALEDDITYERDLYTPFLQGLVERGYDFLIIKSAGNSWVDARYGGVVSAITDADLRGRIIIVGAAQNNTSLLGKHKSYELASFSNTGSLVDVVAPGVDIFSTVLNNNYGEKSGTSMAAPHVTGVAGLVWQANPGLSAHQVKEIIVNTADRSFNQGGQTYNLVNAEAAVHEALRTEAAPPGSAGSRGLIMGSVVDAVTNIGIGSADIEAQSENNPASRYSTTTATDGNYSLTLPAGTYILTARATGYLEGQTGVSIEAEDTRFISPLRLVPEGSGGNGTISGIITNAFTGQSIGSGITLRFRSGGNNTTGTVAAEVVTNQNSRYSVDLPAGNYTAEISFTGFATNTMEVVAVGGQVIDNQNGTISPILSPGETRIILTWGEHPRDLDSHMTGPNPAGGRFHTAYYAKTHYVNGEKFADLDVDDTSSYGPETTTIYNQVAGTYRYAVHDFTNRNSSVSRAMSNSGALVRVFRGSQQIGSYAVPPNQPGTVWTVFELNGDQITPINTMSFESASRNVIP